MFQLECGKCPPQAHFDHVVLSWWHCFENCETFKEAEVAGAGPLGFIAQPHCLSALALFSHDVRGGAWLHALPTMVSPAVMLCLPR